MRAGRIWPHLLGGIGKDLNRVNGNKFFCKADLLKFIRQFKAKTTLSPSQTLIYTND